MKQFINFSEYLTMWFPKGCVLTRFDFLIKVFYLFFLFLDLTQVHKSTIQRVIATGYLILEFRENVLLETGVFRLKILWNSHSTLTQVYTWITLFPLDGSLVPKISKRHFFGDIWNSCHWVTDMGLEPHQKNGVLKFLERVTHPEEIE